MFPIRCNVIEYGTLGGTLKLDEKSCLQYLSELYQFLISSQMESPYRSVLCITRLQWLDFSLDVSSALTENEIESLWSLFASIAMTERFCFPSKSDSKSQSKPHLEFGKSSPQYNIRVSDESSDPQCIAMDFRHFALLLLLQVKITTQTLDRRLIPINI